MIRHCVLRASIRHRFVLERLENRSLLSTNTGVSDFLASSLREHVVSNEQQPPLISSTSAISGVAFLDLNNSLTLDPGERILAGRRVTLTATQNETQASRSQDTITAADGSYSFANLVPGNYSLSFDQPAEFPVGSVIPESMVDALAGTRPEFSSTLQVTVPADGSTPLGQINFVVPDLSILMFLASSPGWAPHSPSRISLTGLVPATYVEDAPPVPFATGLVVDATRIQHLQSATISLTNPLNAGAERLAADIAGTNVVADVDSNGDVLRLTGTDTVSNYQKVLRSLTYENTSQDPNPTPRSIEVAVSDGNLAIQAITATIQIQPVNDAPNLAAIPGQTLFIGEALNLTVSGTDPESRDVLTFQLDPEDSPDSATIEQTDSNTAVVHWTPTDSDLPGRVKFRVLVTDSGTPPATDSEQFSVTIGAS